jgi:hypothetical protein
MNSEQPDVGSLNLHDLVVDAKAHFGDFETNPELAIAEQLIRQFIEIAPEPYVVPLNSLAGATPQTYYEPKNAW